MKNKIKVCFRPAIAEIVEKKSRFIANIAYADTQELALEFINKIKKKYRDARHNCYAYIVGSNFEICKYSDDGEPSLCAGKPMLDILKNEDITDTCVVVSRYFGGVLLGTGGLVKAYQEATKEVLSKSKILERKFGIIYEFILDYSSYGKVKYFIEANNFYILNIEYAQNIRLKVLVAYDKIKKFEKNIYDIIMDNIIFDKKECTYLLDGNKFILE